MISIIVPIFKVEEYLEECLSSIQSQCYKDFEVLCVNDGSPDKSAAICQKFVDEDSRFILINQENGGVSSARNRALKEAKGEYVCFVDSDDIIEPHFLENLLSQSKNGAFAVCSYSRNLSRLTTGLTRATEYDNKEFIKHILNESIEHPNIWMMLFKNSIIQMKQLDFTPGCVRNEDTEFYMKYLVHEDKVIVSDYKGYFYRDNPNSAMHVTKRDAFTSFEASERLEKYLADNGIYMEYNMMLYGSIQAYSVSLAREKNKELYEELHMLYNVRQVMGRLLNHPRLLRRAVAIIYIILGKNNFYRLFTMIRK